MSQSADAARSAAEQAEWNAKKWVWVPDIREGYVAGWVNREEEESAEVIMDSGRQSRWVRYEELFKMNPPKFDRVEDIADLTFLNEASVVHNLRLRYGSDAIYTYSGLFLVAINPYRTLPLYSDSIITQYRGKRRDENPPHIFAVAERAWVNMGDERENQSILITGESGAGKTESTKKVIQYLAAIATDAHPPPSTPGHSRSNTLSSNAFPSAMPSSGLPRKQSVRKGHILSPSMSGGGSHLTSRGRLGLLERQILQANPILEAFGNAQTQRNNNSSRFGKFVRIMFAPDGSIAGANIDWYLLEKSRVVYRSEAERSFHVFYQLMAGGGALKEDLLLDGAVENYEYLNKSRREVDGVDDREEWNTLRSAFDTVGFDPSEQFDLFRIVAAILHIGNIIITSTRSDDAVMPDPSQAERVCHLLGVPIGEFIDAVLRPRALAGREWVKQARTRQQSLDELSSLCKTLYEKSFGALVERINRALDRPSSKSTFIGVLDIAGFEIFDVNGYEQLLINYTNEKLQQFFNHHMFVLEQEEYARENIHWDYVNFGLDLQPTIDLIESSGNVIGILSCLDEECIMPKADDRTFTNKLNAMWILQPHQQDDEDSHPGKLKYTPARFEQGFIIHHYAAKVEYRTEGWLEKNKDPLNDNLTRVLAASNVPYVAALFAEYADLPTTNANAMVLHKKRTMKKGAFRTVAQRHKEQLASLMLQLRSTQPHFVRCIVPNSIKKPGRMDVPLVLDQLRCNGVLEGIRIARLGYPNRLPFVEFRQRYEILTPGILPKGYLDGREACRRMVASLELDDAIFKLGTSKIFFKAGVLAELEERRDALLFDIFSRLQSVARMYTMRRQVRKRLNRAAAIRTIQRNARVYGELRDWPWWQLYTKVRPLLAATRNDEELRKKELELALVRERAERDKQEKENLEKLKMTLEAEKRKVEDELEAERLLAIDKDASLDRSKQEEAKLLAEIANLESDIDELDGHLNRAMKGQKDMQEKYETLRQAFDEAAGHLVRLEKEENSWRSKEPALNDQLRKAQDEIAALHSDIDRLGKASTDLENVVAQREETLARAKEREDAAIKELRGKIQVETDNKNIYKERAILHENEARQAKEQLSELTRTANDYSNMIQRKEDQIVALNKELEVLKAEKEAAVLEVMELRADIDTLDGQLAAERQDHAAENAASKKVIQERDELRALLATKASEETRRSEVEKRKEAELSSLRSETSKLHQDLADLKRTTLEAQNKLKLELDHVTRDHSSLQTSHRQLVDTESAAQNSLTKAQAQISELEKAKRTLESELLNARSRQHEGESQIAELKKVKESVERQLTAAQDKYRNFEDVVLEFQQEKETRTRELEATKTQLDTETAKRTQLEKSLANYKSETAKLRERSTKLDKDLNKALKDLKDREWEVKQLESKQDKTIVEHVHVLEEAKRVTDKQLQDAQKELERNAKFIQSLQVAKQKMAGETEDLNVKYSRELQAKHAELKAQERRTAETLAEKEKERQAKEEAQLNIYRVQTELKQSRQQLEETEEKLVAANRAKNSLEAELERLVEDTGPINDDSLAKMQRGYESRIAQLEGQLDESEMAKVTATRIQEQLKVQHEEILRFIKGTGTSNLADKEFRARLMKEVERSEEALRKELAVRSKNPRLSGANELRSLPQTPLSKRTAPSITVSNAQSFSTTTPSPQRTSDKQVAALKQQVQLLEVQMAASTRVRRHLEASVRDLTAELDRSDGSKAFLEKYKARLVKENERLSSLLQEEADARRSAESAQVDGVQAMWSKFQKSISEERESYNRLEESRKALLVQQRTTQGELEAQRVQVRELTQAKKLLQNEVNKFKEQQGILKTEAENAKRQLQQRVQDDTVANATSSAAQSELRTVIKALTAKEQETQKRYEATERDRATAERAKQSAERRIAELEAALKKDAEDAKAALKSYQKRIKALESQLEREGRDSSDNDVIRQRLAEELEDERDRHKKDLEERDFNAEQNRKVYQAHLTQLTEDLQSRRDALSQAREENRNLRSEYEALVLKHNDEISNSGGWRDQRERLETKISDLERAYEASTGANTEQAGQIVALHSQISELRAVLDDAEADRALLQKARRALQAELETIKIDGTEGSRERGGLEVRKLQLKKSDLERSLEEQKERVKMASERVRKAEKFASDCQVELGKVRVENSELDKFNASLEKQVKELKVRIVDLETKYVNSPQRTAGRRADSRIEELTTQLEQTTKGRRESARMVSGMKSQMTGGDEERYRAKVEQYESQINEMRQRMDAMRTEESGLQVSKRRVEREALEYRQRVLSLERELERLRTRK